MWLILVRVRHHRAIKCLAMLVMFFGLFKILEPNFFSYTISYFQIIIDMVNSDRQRHSDIMRQEAEVGCTKGGKSLISGKATIQEKIIDKKYLIKASCSIMTKLVWGYHQLQKRFMQQICKEKNLPEKKYLWLVSLSSDNVLPGAVAVALSIKRISCYTKIGAMVTPNLNNLTISILEQVGYEMFHVESLDCNWMDRSMKLPASNSGIPGTHTRFQAWSLVQFEKVVYVDIDYMLLTNIDEIFDSENELSAVYCARPGVLDPCFNAGLAVLRPSLKTRADLLAKWKELTEVMGCVSDQIVLWYYFAFTGRWNPLPYSYNVRRKLFYPMKAYHFAGYGVTTKPWEMENPPTRKEALDFSGPAIHRDHMNILWWQLFYNALDQYNLHQWWNTR